MNSRPVLLVDSLNLFCRHLAANPAMTANGESAGAIVGFLSNIRLMVELYHPKRIVIFWESGGSDRRRAIFPGYKQGSRPKSLNRYYGDDIPESEKNRNWQTKTIIEILKHTPVNQVYVKNCEADDMIAYAASNLFSNEQCIVLSSDKDLYQLISERVQQWSPGQKKLISVNDVIQKFGVHPNNFCLARTFVGDSSDSIDGVPRVGFSTIVKEFPEFGMPDDILMEEILQKSANSTRKTKAIANINENSEIIRRNWKLMYLSTSMISGEQAQKIEHQAKNDDYSNNKMEILRILNRAQISCFDADSFFSNILTVTR